MGIVSTFLRDLSTNFTLHIFWRYQGIKLLNGRNGIAMEGEVVSIEIYFLMIDLVRWIFEKVVFIMKANLVVISTLNYVLVVLCNKFLS